MDPEQRELMLNFLRMHKLREIATPILLQIFLARWAELMQIEQQNVGTSSAESQWKDGSECGEELVKICKTNGVFLPNWVMKEVLIGDTSNWDVSILANAIQAITKIILLKDPNAINYSAYTVENTHINTIQNLRNKISHTSKSELAYQEFNPLWQEMSNALEMLGVDKAQLETVKAMDFAKPMKILTEAERIKAQANEAYSKKKFAEAIELYTRILQMEGLPADSQAIVYSNRSLAYLNRGDSVEHAIADARLAIHMRPTWERGYIRLGMAYKTKGELDKALDQLETAQTMNPNASDLREEISALRQKIGYQSRRDYATPHPELDTEEEQLEQVRQRLGMAPEAFQRLREMGENHPEFGDIIKGHRYRDGIGGVQQDYGQAAKYFSRATAKGNPDGMYNLALLYGEGNGVQRNFETSLFWLRKAAAKKSRVENFVESGIAEAQHALGLRYSDGIWVAQDYKEAAKWYQMAVDNGFGPSANNLGLFYKNGTGVERSLKKAFQLFEMASEKEHTPGMMNLAMCYLMAEGTGSFMPSAADREMALYWLQKATSLGDTYAAEKLENIKKLPLGYFQEASLCSLSTPQVVGFQNALSDEHRQYVPEVKDAAEKGSKTAQDVLTIWNCQRAAMDAFKQGDHAKLVQQMATALRLHHELVNVPELFRPIIDKRLKENPNDRDTIICYIGLNSRTATQELFEFIGNCLQKFPTDPFLVEMRAIGFSMGLNQHKEAIKLIEKALRSHPNNIRLLYCRANFFSMDDPHRNFDATNAAWDAFLAVAPEDQRKVPQAFYRKAANFLGMKDMPKFVQHFEMGQAAEKKMLPCFLPYFRQKR